MADCLTNGRGNLFSLDTSPLELFGPVVEVMMDVGDLCRSQPYYVVMPEHRTAAETFKQCRSLGAKTAVPTTTLENAHLLDTLSLFSDTCSNSVWKMWLGIVDEEEEGVWVDVSTNTEITFTNFKPPYPFGGTALNCASLFEDGFWGDEICSNYKCAACHHRRSDYLYLRGLCFQSEHETRFRVEGYLGGRPLFRGFYDRAIMWDEVKHRWLLIIPSVNSTLAWVDIPDTRSYPLGHQHWVTEETVCGKGHGANITLSLSPCASHQFMCASGDCVDSQLRCDLRYDCDDGDDEDDCEIIVLNRGYRRHLPPVEAEGSLLKLSPSVTLSRFTDINDIKMTFAIEFHIALSWKDGRLNFRHLITKKKNTVLGEEEVARIWTPQYQLVNVEGGQVQVLAQAVALTTTNNVTFPHHNDVIMDVSYPGSHNPLTQTRQYTGKFICAFELYAYPFDVQLCSINIRLPQAYEDYVQFSDTQRSVLYAGPKELSSYIIYNVRLGEVKDGGWLTVEFELHRRQGVIVLATFLPSVLLLLVSWATLFIKLEALNVRAIMSLTTLLVLYTLFSNTSRTLPATATIKLIDVWFLFIIVLLFINIMIHIFITLTTDDTWFRRVSKPLTVVDPIVSENTHPSSVATSPKFLAVYRIIIFPTIVFIFGVTFIVLCYRHQ
ncbi:uncharacterized protein LOC121853570 [Homarus americanus]|uniref:uncharacterized protein LOC121853570 n=2 Tax=Homarus americanus TaxID=6706 RepID=UPI001C47B147|nr:uncharacterized protein LOC121853570 [Homarus americanus]